MKKNPHTALGRLALEQQQVRQECQTAEQRILHEWKYVRSHAGRLLFSEIKNVLMPGRRRKDAHEDGGSFLDSSWIHVAWQMAKPMLYGWMGHTGWRALKAIFHHHR